ncbi:uncharacterized protein LOC116299268 [Actinia tenebrosa]|uniref:Uncharacterized protein LOC116299268 n=1 Tax=Actinia tenebrosa TaxID=6105 RepID=A0A6P8I5D3_ACTTE|nr:uncharacterized protein LOC116299268 [Actinia tenebrosa]
MKVICAGLPQTGTTSIAHALRILGYKVYDYDEQILYYMNEWLDLYKHGKVPDFYAMFKDVDVVIDYPGNFFFEEIMEAFPDAKVILSEREEDIWIRRYVNNMELFASTNKLIIKMQNLIPTFKKFWFVILNLRMASLGISDPKSSYICRKRYRWHNDRVKSVVPADKLLVYSVKQGWEPLCEFTGKKIPDQPFPHLNIKGEIFRTYLTETELGRKIAQEFRVAKVCCVAVMVALIGVVLIYLFTLF